MKTSLIIDQHLEHSQWLKTIDFYRDEIKIIQSRLEEVASKNTGKEIAVQVEHFQNQLIIQRSTLDQLSHDIHIHEQELTANVIDNPVASDRRKLPVPIEHEEGMMMFEKIFNELRHDFIRFLAKVM